MVRCTELLVGVRGGGGGGGGGGRGPLLSVLIQQLVYNYDMKLPNTSSH